MWAGEQLFGSIGPELTARSPVTVRIVAPHQARAVAFLPLESAVVAGRPLALQRVSLVIQVDTERAVAARVKDPVSGRLRILALFSLPEGASALNLRRERYGLARLVEEIAATNNKAIELKVLQYGVTRQRLRPVSALAVRLAERLDVAVLAMRFPVTDDFAVGLAEGLYDRVIGKGQPLPGALGLALPPLLTADRIESSLSRLGHMMNRHRPAWGRAPPGRGEVR